MTDPAAAREPALFCALDEPTYLRIRPGERNRFRGMVFDVDAGAARTIAVAVDGAAAGEFSSREASPDLGQHVPHLPDAAACRFDFTLDVPTGARSISFEARWDGGRREEIFEYDLGALREIGITRERLDALPMPDAAIVNLTQGHGDVEGYRDSIAPSAYHLRRYLTAASVATGDVRKVLDFGCGSGRTLVGWSLADPSLELFGCDINAALIDWAQANLPARIHVRRIAPDPPLPYGAGEFDFICALSVFTHLSFPSQERWARELARIVRPGGVFLATLHGLPYVRLFLPDRVGEFEARGHVEVDRGTDGGNASASFHAAKIVPDLFEGFDLLRRFPAGRFDGRAPLFPLAGLQDVYVLRRRR